MNPPKADPSAPAAARDTPWPIFVLSLEGEEARRAPLLNSLATMGLEAEVLIGVDGRKGLPHWAEAEVNRDVGWGLARRPLRPMTNSELACALSHVLAYRKISDEGLPGAVIFEDDATINDAFKDFVDARGYELAEMVLLGHEETWVRPNSERPLCKGVVGHRLVASPVLAHGYSLSRRAAEYIHERATPVRARADWPCDISRIKSLAADPQIAMQPADRNANSHLEGDRIAARREDKARYGGLSRLFSAAYIKRKIRKRLDPQRVRRLFGRRIA